jgi:hypothetical protein
MTSRGHAIARALLKTAGKSETAASALKQLAHGTMDVISHVGEHGGRFAESLGAPKNLGVGLAVGGTLLGGAQLAKSGLTAGANRVDQWRARHGLISPGAGYPQGY